MPKAKVRTGRTCSEICRGPPPPSQLRPHLCCSYPIALVSHQTGSHSIQAQGPGRDLTKLVMIQVNPGAKESTHTEQLLQTHSLTSLNQQSLRSLSSMETRT